MTAAYEPTIVAVVREVSVWVMMRSVGIDVAKRSFRACIKDDEGVILGEFTAPNSAAGFNVLLRHVEGSPTRAVVEATGNHWVRIHDTLEEHGVECLLANPVKTRLIAEARIKSDKLDARILADLLRGNLVAESYVPTCKERDWRSLVRHRASLVRTATEVKNRVHALLDKYDLEPGYSDLFGKKGFKWLEGLKLKPVDQAILSSDLRLLENLEDEVTTITREIASVAVDERQVRLLMTIPGIDYYSAVLVLAEVGDVTRFPSARKLASWAGLVPSLHQSGSRTYSDRITKKGSKWLRWVLVQAAQKASISDGRLSSYYERVSKRRGHHKAIVAVAREMLTIMWHMLVRNEAYRGENRRLTEQKLKKMERLVQG